MILKPNRFGNTLSTPPDLPDSLGMQFVYIQPTEGKNRETIEKLAETCTEITQIRLRPAPPSMAPSPVLAKRKFVETRRVTARVFVMGPTGLEPMTSCV